MLILSIESSCDETSAAVTENGRRVLSDEILSQIDIHTVYGGVVPELASRNHIKVIKMLADEAVRKAGISKKDIDAVAVTFAPGLIGALLVGVSFAKAAAFSLGVPLIPVHHIRGHVAANYIAYPELEPPFACLVASGGSSLVLDVRSYTDFRVLGSTRDDAAGECFDKAARVLGIGYPGGAMIDSLAKTGDPYKYKLPRSRVEGSPFDMSFSGLKTAVVNLAHNAKQKGEQLDLNSLAASLCLAVSDTLVSRAIEAAAELGYGKLAVAGGVAANSMIRDNLLAEAQKRNITAYLAPLSLCGDNAAMIGSQAYYEYLSGSLADSALNAYATLSPESGYNSVNLVSE
ncbi:MAG: tRNA (adenosine(37)-N6)-threonylcarbamoyltransferase complex transferase subunit TsaD [Papillibacter sp.]|jgi:N6-L-threonylcarbamoyladenine synthase|nr:tRNA (adenosine(37)-N6)-threonylcarbamoyltransferase complex transferase subunit TsaD [Papillibacter sp.]